MQIMSNKVDTSEFNPTAISPEVTEILQVFEKYKSASDNWHEMISDDISFVTPGGQWTKEQITALKLRGQAPIESDIITPTVVNKVGIVAGNDPGFKVSPRTDTDVNKAKLFALLCTWVWNKNSGNLITQEIIKNQHICSKGYYYVYYDNYADEGYGMPVIESIHPLCVVPDPYSERIDEEDSIVKFIMRYIAKDQAKDYFPEWANVIDQLIPEKKEPLFRSNFAQSENIQRYDELMVDVDQSAVLYLTEQRKIQVKYYVVQYNDPDGNFAQRELSESEFQAFQETMNNDPEMATVFDSIRAREIYKTRIKERRILGNQLVSEEILPVSHYTIIPVAFDHIGNPYTVSLTRKMKGTQQYRNFNRTLMIAHATNSTNAKVLLPIGAVQDPQQLEIQWAKPNAIIEYDATMGKPEVVQPVPLPNAHYAIDTITMRDGEFISGSFRLSHGDPAEAPKTKGGTAMLDQNSLRSSVTYTKNLYRAIEMVGNAVIKFIQEYMSNDRIIRLANPWGESEEEMIEIGLGDKFNDETIQAIKEPKSSEYDIEVRPGSMTAGNRFQELEYYMALYERGIIDQVEVLKKVDIFDRRGVLERTSKVKQLTGALENLTEEHKMLTGQMRKMADDLVRLRRESIASKETAKFIQKETELENKFNQKMLRVEELINELELAKQKVKSDTKTPTERK